MNVGILVVAFGRHDGLAPDALLRLGVGGVLQDSGTVRVVFINPRVLTWHTGVPAMGFFAAPPDSTIAECRATRITHVVLGDINIDPGRSRSMASAVAAHSHAFRQLYTAGVFTVYAFDSTQALP